MTNLGVCIVCEVCVCVCVFSKMFECGMSGGGHVQLGYIMCVKCACA